ncbi:hypothetical protein A3D11_00410 [Candidatus Peribacteria bacterium RIFCSPHIGHO2_02_FULL_49_16]|nr:MAG: hypothetical protein A2880_02520 [Candidatus Peribacteria bacterium RIFCSPHIGHO2_01_FULL_49_38]OGJ59070.1 MAG: hypothetical protein A3D11_00410 [Candidatus Peribacteria bacterium RIFCSPHIGHO2_02_FULL_49_16]
MNSKPKVQTKRNKRIVNTILVQHGKSFQEHIIKKDLPKPYKVNTNIKQFTKFIQWNKEEMACVRASSDAALFFSFFPHCVHWWRMINPDPA